MFQPSKLARRVRLPAPSAALRRGRPGIPAAVTMHSIFCFYVLRSLKSGRLYKGQTQDIEQRVRQHNTGKTRSTKAGRPWRLVYSETYAAREQAIERERYFKSLKGGRELKKILAASLTVNANPIGFSQSSQAGVA
ncbi:MAG: GIY-YIG nuclease family protein [bacterium]